ncbi:hypothetical protein [Streptomyces sp. KL116D]|uniref:hypothetical protein n=1 Tax=Streptomyces sp. KL116D TaxID=3045152 RepID=UPI0035591E9E
MVITEGHQVAGATFGAVSTVSLMSSAACRGAAFLSTAALGPLSSGPDHRAHPDAQDDSQGDGPDTPQSETLPSALLSRSLRLREG